MSIELATVWDWLGQTPAGDRAPLLAISGVMVILLIIVIAVIVSKTACRIQKARLENGLKRELVDRGFSAEEIERIVRASAGDAARRGDT